MMSNDERKKRRRWPLILVVAVIVMATLAIIWYYIPPQYDAYEWVRVDRTPRTIYRSLEPKNPYVHSRLWFEDKDLNDLNVHQEIVLSSMVLDTVLQQPGIAQLSCLKNETDKADWLRKNLKVHRLGSSGIIEIRISGSDPEALVKIVSAVRAAYVDRVTTIDREMNILCRMQLENERKALDDRIAAAKTEIQDMPEDADGLKALRSELESMEEDYRQKGALHEKLVAEAALPIRVKMINEPSWSPKRVIRWYGK